MRYTSNNSVESIELGDCDITDDNMSTLFRGYEKLFVKRSGIEYNYGAMPFSWINSWFNVEDISELRYFTTPCYTLDLSRNNIGRVEV